MLVEPYDPNYHSVVMVRSFATGHVSNELPNWVKWEFI